MTQNKLPGKWPFFYYERPGDEAQLEWRSKCLATGHTQFIVRGGWTHLHQITRDSIDEVEVELSTFSVFFQVINLHLVRLDAVFQNLASGINGSYEVKSQEQTEDEEEGI